MVISNADISIEISEYSTPHASIISELAASAFLNVAEQERPVHLTAAAVDALLCAANPSGPSLVALAMRDKKPVGSFAVVPTRFRLAAGGLAIGYQTHQLWIDHNCQRQGIGTLLMQALTDHVIKIDNSFIYTFPNQRSLGVFQKVGYEKVSAVPTYVMPTMAVPLGAIDDAPFEIGGERGPWHCKPLKASELHSQLDKMRVESSQPGFIRDVEYIGWRFGHQGHGLKYRFLYARCEEDTSEFLVVLTRHAFANMTFLIISDLLSNQLTQHFAPAARAVKSMGARQRLPFLYIDTNLVVGADGKKRAGVPLNIAVPAKVHPRPCQLWMHPKTNAVTFEELAKAPVLTGDWGGF